MFTNQCYSVASSYQLQCLIEQTLKPQKAAQTTPAGLLAVCPSEVGMVVVVVEESITETHVRIHSRNH